MVYLAVIAEIILWLDLISKYFVRSQLSTGETRNLLSGNQDFLQLVHLPNSGISLGFFQNANIWVTYLSLVITLLIITYDLSTHRDIDLGRFGLAIFLGGVLGNLIDRLAYGYVTDIFLFFALPVFNIADVCIVAGVVFLVIDVLAKARQKFTLI
jgi:signal peptidase II